MTVKLKILNLTQWMCLIVFLSVSWTILSIGMTEKEGKRAELPEMDAFLRSYQGNRIHLTQLIRLAKEHNIHVYNDTERTISNNLSALEEGELVEDASLNKTRHENLFRWTRNNIRTNFKTEERSAMKTARYGGVKEHNSKGDSDIATAAQRSKPITEQSENKTRTSILPKIFTQTQNTTRPSRFDVPEKCAKVNDVFFLKTHKTGSDTVAQILLRFADLNDLSVLLPKDDKRGLGWPWQMKPNFYHPPKQNHFNVFCLHAVYNGTLARKMMSGSAKYVTILRNPWSQFKSAYSYFAWDRRLNKTNPADSRQPVERFFLQPKEFYQWYEKKGAAYQRNFMAFDLGFPPSMYDNVNGIVQFIAGLDRDFDLVMILEYFDESLILLKRTLCWELTDIIYVPLNVRKKRFAVNDDTEKFHRRYSQADYALYDHFKSKFLQRIAGERDFAEELLYFKEQNYQFKRFCKFASFMPNATMVIEESKWNDQYELDSTFCYLSRVFLLDYLNVLRKKIYGINYDNIRKPFLWQINLN